MSLSSQAIFGAICVLSIAAETQLLVQTLPHAYGVFDDAMQTHFSDFLAYKPAAAEPCSLLQRLTGACPPPATAPDMGDARRRRGCRRRYNHFDYRAQGIPCPYQSCARFGC